MESETSVGRTVPYIMLLNGTRSVSVFPGVEACRSVEGLQNGGEKEVMCSGSKLSVGLEDVRSFWPNRQTSQSVSHYTQSLCWFLQTFQELLNNEPTIVSACMVIPYGFFLIFIYETLVAYWS